LLSRKGTEQIINARGKSPSRDKHDHMWKKRAALVVLGFPLLYGMLNSAWLYPSFDLADAHVGIGISRRFFDFDYRIEAPQTYKISRVPTIVFQATTKKVLPIHLAQYVITLVPLICLGGVFYLAVSKLLNPQTGIVATTLLMASSHLYIDRYMISGDYMNVAGAAGLIATLLCLRWSQEKDHWLIDLLLGSVFAASLFSNVLATILLGPLLVIELIVTPLNFRRLGRMMRGVFLGAVVTTLSCSTISYFFHKPRFFFRDQINHLIISWKQGGSWLVHHRNLSDFISEHGFDHLALIFMVFLLTAVIIVIQCYKSLRQGLLSSTIRKRSFLWKSQFILVGTYFFWQKINHGILLDVIHHTHPLLISMYFALAAIIYETWQVSTTSSSSTPAKPETDQSPVIASNARFASMMGAIGLAVTVDALLPRTLFSPIVTFFVTLAVSGLAGLILWLCFSTASRERLQAFGCVLAISLICYVSSGCGELWRKDPYRINRAFFEADHQLWSQLRTEGADVVNYLFYHNARKPLQCNFGGIETTMSLSRFGVTLADSVGMRYLGPIEMEPDPAPWPSPGVLFPFVQRMSNMEKMFEEDGLPDKFVDDPHQAVVVFGVSAEGAQQFAEQLSHKSIKMRVHKKLYISTHVCQLSGYLLVSQ
jgi:hypothetical protein